MSSKRVIAFLLSFILYCSLSIQIVSAAVVPDMGSGGGSAGVGYWSSTGSANEPSGNRAGLKMYFHSRPIGEYKAEKNDPNFEHHGYVDVFPSVTGGTSPIYLFTKDADERLINVVVVDGAGQSPDNLKVQARAVPTSVPTSWRLRNYNSIIIDWPSSADAWAYGMAGRVLDSLMHQMVGSANTEILERFKSTFTSGGGPKWFPTPDPGEGNPMAQFAYLMEHYGDFDFVYGEDMSEEESDELEQTFIADGSFKKTTGFVDVSKIKNPDDWVEGAPNFKMNERMAVANVMWLIALSNGWTKDRAYQLWRSYLGDGNALGGEEAILILEPFKVYGSITAGYYAITLRNGTDMVAEVDTPPESWYRSSYDMLTANSALWPLPFNELGSYEDANFTNGRTVTTFNRWMMSELWSQDLRRSNGSIALPQSKLSWWYRRGFPDDAFTKDVDAATSLQQVKAGFNVIYAYPNMIMSSSRGSHKLTSKEERYKVPAGSTVTAEQLICFKQDDDRFQLIADHFENVLNREGNVVFERIRYKWVETPSEHIALHPNTVMTLTKTPTVEDTENGYNILGHAYPGGTILSKDDDWKTQLRQYLFDNGDICNIQVSTTTETNIQFTGSTHEWPYSTMAVLDFYPVEDPDDKQIFDLDIATALTVIEVDPPPVVPPTVKPEPKTTARLQNTPVGYAEIKHKQFSPDRSKEKFEAMSGIPTTETMYVNVGGTPVYVDMIVRKYENMQDTSPPQWSGTATNDCGIDHAPTYNDDGEMTDEGGPHTGSYTHTITFEAQGSYLAMEQVKFYTADEVKIVAPEDILEDENIEFQLKDIVVDFKGTKIYKNKFAGLDPDSHLTYTVGPTAASESEAVCTDGVTETTKKKLANQVHSNHEGSNQKVVAKSDRVIMNVDGHAYVLMITGDPTKDAWSESPQKYQSTMTTYNHSKASDSIVPKAEIMNNRWNNTLKPIKDSTEKEVSPYASGGGTMKIYDVKKYGAWVEGWQGDWKDDWNFYQVIEVQGYKEFFDPLGYMGDPTIATERNSKDTYGDPFIYMATADESKWSDLKMNLNAINGIHPAVSGEIIYGVAPMRYILNDTYKPMQTLTGNYHKDGYGFNDGVNHYEEVPMIPGDGPGDTIGFPTKYLNPSKAAGAAKNGPTNDVLIWNPISIKNSKVTGVPESVLNDQRINKDSNPIWEETPKTYIDFNFDISIPHYETYVETDPTKGRVDCLMDEDGVGPGYGSITDTSLWIRRKYVKFNIPIVVKKTVTDVLWAVDNDYKYYPAETWIPLYDDGRDAAIPRDQIDFIMHVPENQPDKHLAEAVFAAEAINAVPDASWIQGDTGSVQTNHPGLEDSESEGPGIAIDADAHITNNTDPKIKTSGGYEVQAAHIVRQQDEFDVIGRIGNVIIDDSTDPRWADVFWEPVTTNEWLIPNVSKLPVIRPSSKALMYTDKLNMYKSNVDITSSEYALNRWHTLHEYHNVKVQRSPGNDLTRWGNTALPWTVGDVPIGPGSNPKRGLQDTAIYMGYPVQYSLQTVGSYGGSKLKVYPDYIYADAEGTLHDNISLKVQTSGLFREYYNSGASDPAGYSPSFNFQLARSLGDPRAKINSYERSNSLEASSPPSKWDPMVKKKLGHPHFIEIGQDLMTYIGDNITTGKVSRYENETTINLTDAEMTSALNAPDPPPSRETFLKNAQRWHLMGQLPSSTIIEDNASKKVYDLEEGHIIMVIEAVTDAAESGKSPWDLSTKSGVVYDVLLKAIIERPLVPGDPYPPINPHPNPPDVVTSVPDIPIVIWETGNTSATDADLVGTH